MNVDTGLIAPIVVGVVIFLVFARRPKAYAKPKSGVDAIYDELCNDAYELMPADMPTSTWEALAEAAVSNQYDLLNVYEKDMLIQVYGFKDGVVGAAVKVVLFKMKENPK